MKRLFTVIVLLLVAAVSLPAQTQSGIRSSVRFFRESNERHILREFIDLLSIPNVAEDAVNISRNAEFLLNAMSQRGITTKLLKPPAGKGVPAVYGELRVPGAFRTIVFYAHYDGQPAHAEQWHESTPWEPIFRTAAREAGGVVIPFPAKDRRIEGQWRVYARSASDDKSPILALLTAIDALNEGGIPLTANLKFYFDGEEEDGSPTMEEVLLANKDLLQADAWIICDGPVHQNGQKLVYFGARGVVTSQITVYGALRDLHSGHYGNWAPNPAVDLATLIASMKDETGRVTIEGFYDDTAPLGEKERRALAEMPDFDGRLMRELGLARVEGAGNKLAELILLPSLTVNGIQSAYVGDQARTIIPSSATMRIDMRLVQGNDPARQIERLKAHIVKQGFFVTDKEPDMQTRLAHTKVARVTYDRGYGAFRTAMDLPISLAVLSAVQAVSDSPIVKLPSLGGSVPMSFIPNIFRVPVIGLPIVNYDNNQHSGDENVRLQNLWDGIEIYAAVMTMR